MIVGLISKLNMDYLPLFQDCYPEWEIRGLDFYTDETQADIY